MHACSGISKNRWSAEETDLLRDVVATHGARSWNIIASFIPGRNAKQCRERWSTYCDPEFKREKWTPEEEDRLMELHRTYGNRWSTFSKFLNNRSPVAIRNRWMCIKRRHANLPCDQITPVPPITTTPTTTTAFTVNWDSMIDEIFGDFPTWTDDSNLLM